MRGVDKSEEVGAVDKCCASCGTPEVDDVKLKACDGCDLVNYCSDACQQNHQPEHELKCKERAAELRDEILFRQPEGTHLGDCPICCLPLQIDLNKCHLMACCSKLICIGCEFANMTCRGLEEEQVMGTTCPFCRDPMRDEEAEKNRMKRIEANDPVAIREMGVRHLSNRDYAAAFEFFRRAAKLGDLDAHYHVGSLYKWGEGVEMDEKKALYHVEEAAIGGHPETPHAT